MYLGVHSCILSLILHRAMASQSAKEQFLKQFEQIVEGVKQNKAKVSLGLFLLGAFVGCFLFNFVSHFGSDRLGQDDNVGVYPLYTCPASQDCRY